MRPVSILFAHSFLLGPIGMVYYDIAFLFLNGSLSSFEEVMLVGVVGSIVSGILSFVATLLVFLPAYYLEKSLVVQRNTRQVIEAYMPAVSLIMVVFSLVIIAASDFSCQAVLVSFLLAAYLNAGTGLLLFSKYMAENNNYRKYGNSNRKNTAEN